MLNLKSIVALASLTLFVGACGNYDKGGAPETGDFQELTGEKVSFATISSQILKPHCLRCHAQYDDYESVKIESEQILQAVLGNRMPKDSGPLNDELKTLLATWIADGAPFEPDAPLPPVTSKLEPTWESLSRRVIAPKCMACHNPNGQARFLDLSSRQAFFANRERDYFGQKLIDFEQPRESYLISIVTDEFEPMPPPPPISNLGRLTEEEVDILIEWIKNGLP